MNIIEIMGNLGADPETRFTASGQKVISLRLASNTRKAGKDETTWWRVTIWEDRCKIDKMLPYLKKGSSLIIIGEMSASLYTDKEGRPQISLDVTADLVRFSPFGRSDSAKQEAGQGAYNQQSSRQSYGDQPFSGQSQSQFTGESSYGSGSSSNMNEFADDDHIPF